MKIIDLKQGSDEWLEFRRTHIGASDIGILMAGSKKEVYELYLSKTIGKEKFKTSYMLRGTEMEQEARNWANTCGLWPCIFEPLVAIHDEYQWLMASFDGYDTEKEIVLEIKCPRDFGENLEDHDSYPKWYWQVQAQLAVANVEKAILLAYDPSYQSSCRIDRDEDQIARLIKAGSDFRERVINYDPPEEPIPERSDMIAFDAVTDWKKAKENLDDAVAAEKDARNRVISISNGESFSCNGTFARKIYKQGTVDYKAIPELEGVDLDKYRKMGSEYWRLS